MTIVTCVQICSGFISIPRKLLPFTVCADNSLFSVYKFLAQNIQLSTITLASNVPTLVLQSQRSASTCHHTSPAPLLTLSGSLYNLYLGHDHISKLLL